MVFKNNLGLLKRTKAKMFVDVDATLRFFKPRLVSYYLKEKFEQELPCLKGNGMISPVRFSDCSPQTFLGLLLKTMVLFASVEIIRLQQISWQNKTPTHCQCVEDLFADHDDWSV